MSFDIALRDPTPLYNINFGEPAVPGGTAHDGQLVRNHSRLKVGIVDRPISGQERPGVIQRHRDHSSVALNPWYQSQAYLGVLVRQRDAITGTPAVIERYPADHPGQSLAHKQRACPTDETFEDPLTTNNWGIDEWGDDDWSA